MNITKELEHGPIKVIGGKHKGRIGYYDFDDIDDNNTKVGYIYLGSMSVCRGYYEIPFEYIRPVTSDDLISRKNSICTELTQLKEPSVYNQRCSLLEELHYIEIVLNSRMDIAINQSKTGRKLIFISHSSKDKTIAKYLSVDLANKGHKPWLDTWEIRAGESIPQKISQGLEECDYVLVILSKNSTKSNWVEREWQAKYWDEIENGKIHVIPILYENCKIPFLLKSKKYADFTEDYHIGFSELIYSIL